MEANVVSYVRILHNIDCYADTANFICSLMVKLGAFLFCDVN